MTWKTPHQQILEELGPKPKVAGILILSFVGLFWFSAIGFGLWLTSFF